MSTIFQCPECKSVLRFTSSKTNLQVCQRCKSVVHLGDLNNPEIKPQHIVSNTASVIQPGTTGLWKDRSFTVLGRCRAWFEESVFNYWTIDFGSDQLALLAEGYGLYSVLTPTVVTESLQASSASLLDPGDIKEIGKGKKYITEKKNKCILWEIEGEIFAPFLASTFLVTDLSTKEGSSLAIFTYPQFGIRAYEEEYCSFASLQLKNLRDYTSTGKTFTCSKCSSDIYVKTFPYAQSCGCPSCGTYYELKHGVDFKKKNNDTKTDYQHLPLGKTGEIQGIQYEIIGFALKEEKNEYQSQWREYTLFNPLEGYAFLSEYNGHWIYVREQGISPVLLTDFDKTIHWKQEPFRLYNSYTAKVVNARGEFPYNIFDNTFTKVKEFISPPEVWIQERDSKEGITWYWGIHQSPADIKKAFSPDRLPYRVGIGAVQTTGYVSPGKLIGFSVLAFFLLILIHACIGFTKKEKIILDQDFMFNDSSNEVSYVTDKFTLDKWSSNLELSIHALVSNSWFELNATLVNSATGKEYSLSKGVEYYSGYSDGEHWTEGSTHEDAYFSRIPAGTYFLQLQGTREQTYYPIMYFGLRVTNDVSNHRNLWICALLLMIWPLVKGISVYITEKSRWSNSPFSNFEE